PARADVELGEHLAQVPLDGAGADEELGTDLGVRQAVTCEARDLLLLRGQLVARLCAPHAHLLAGCCELAACALRECIHADRREHVVRRSQLPPREHATTLASEPLAVQKMRARDLRAEARPGQAVYRLVVELSCVVTLCEQCTASRLDAERPVGT